MQKNNEFLMDMLSPREKEIFLLKDKGMSERQIANKLGLSKTTINKYIERVEKKWSTTSEQIQKNYDIIKTKRKIK